MTRRSRLSCFPRPGLIIKSEALNDCACTTASNPSAVRHISVSILRDKTLTEVGPEWLHHPAVFHIAIKHIKTGHDGFRSLSAMREAERPADFSFRGRNALGILDEDV